jgi:hypothetical protein
MRTTRPAPRRSAHGQTCSVGVVLKSRPCQRGCGLRQFCCALAPPLQHPTITLHTTAGLSCRTIAMLSLSPTPRGASL